MELYGCQANTMSDVFRYYYKHNLKYVNIIVNLTQDKKIAISTEDDSAKRMKHLLRLNILTLDEFLKHIPEDLNVNIEVCRYGGKQNALPNNIICRIIMATKKRGKRNVVYSSADKEIARIALCNRRDAWFIINDEYTLNSDLSMFNKICIHKSLVEKINEPLKEKEIYVTGIENTEELNSFLNNTQLTFIKGYISKF